MPEPQFPVVDAIGFRVYFISLFTNDLNHLTTKSLENHLIHPVLKMTAKLKEITAASFQLLAVLSTVPAQRHGLSTETPRLHEATRHLAAKAAFAPARLADTTTADRPGATPRAAAPAWARLMPVEDLAAVVEVRTAAVAIAAAGTGNRSSYTLLSLHEHEMERSNATHHRELRSPLSRDLS